MSVHAFPGQNGPGSGTPVDSGGGPPHDEQMEARVKKLEDDLLTIRVDLAVVRSNYATKEDLHKELHNMTWKIIGSIALLCGIVFWVAKNVAPPPAPSPSPSQGAPITPQAASPAPPPQVLKP